MQLGGGRQHVNTGFYWANLWGKRPLERPRRRWEDNIKIELKEMVYEVER
jgi:hypothetical protein